jgi:hypothetical protein
MEIVFQLGTSRPAQAMRSRDVLLENVVLHGAGEFSGLGPAAPSCGDVHGQQSAGCGVDGHRSRNLIETNAGEEALHVFKRADGDAGAAHFAQCER